MDISVSNSQKESWEEESFGVQASNSGEESGGREVFEPLPPRKAQGAEGGSGIIKDKYFTGSRTERKPRGLWESC